MGTTMSRLRRFVLVGIAAGLALYVTSYWAIREANTVRYEKDGCPQSGCEEVSFPVGGLYLVFAPMYQLDKFTDPQTDFHVVRY
jgi:hypothetical protein